MVDVLVLGDANPTFACCGNFEKIERIGSCPPEQTHRATFVKSPERLTRVFDQDESSPFTEGENRIHISRSSAHVHEHNGFGLGSEHFFNALGREAEVVVDFGKNRQTSAEQNALNRSDIREGRNHHFISKAQTRRGHSRSHRRGTTAHRMGVWGSREPSNLGFKFSGFPTPLSQGIVVVAKQAACFEHFVDFATLIGAEQIHSRHKKLLY